ncbi:YHYH protein [Oceanobacter sp. 5_MG-2023]|uniref:YHYH protein n=1 Tax=Oceanobacter sp. 5_MG-2023 TaxID=3062645 RepID=UPI0026E1C153|nr:YHYH protein [Oceanobacter sp. 5_MG-2023]MDO6681452.1 YHYH protein [Oceanobacter sp. 5_MG-2023]
MKTEYVIPLLFSGTLALAGCGSSDDSEVVDTTDDSDSSVDIEDDDVADVDTSYFDLASLDSIEVVECTLSNNESSTCYQITVKGFPADRSEIGPFCPEVITATAEDAGKWFDDGVLYDLTGEFIANLDEFYNDNNWLLYDEESGEVNITDTQTSCEAAAVVDVAEEYHNYCVQCDLDYYSDVEGEGIYSTYLIPTTPVVRDSAGDIDGENVGVAFNGVNLAAAAPAEVILSAYTIAAFDDCVGHVNPVAGYHYHGANHGDGDCPAIAFESDGHGGAFAYAMDGFVIYSMLDEEGNEATDLDECRGHTDDVRGYHYHSAGPGENAFIGCFTGETASADDDNEMDERPGR